MHNAGNHGLRISPKTPTEFTFVEQAPAQPSRELRRQVRSHIARLQHSRTRAAGYRSPNHGKYRQSQSTKATRGSRLYHTEQSCVEDSSASDDSDLVVELVSPITLPQSPIAKALSHGTLAFKTFTLADADHVISGCLESLDLNMDSILSRYQIIVQFQSRDFKMNSSFDESVIIWKRFFDFIFADPVLLSAVILLTVRHIYVLQSKPFLGKQLVAITTLEQLLVQRINGALSAGLRGVSDHMLVTVALCAAYEIIHGTSSAYKIHMSGLVQMILLRGGLRAIGAQDPYLERLLVWHDMNTSNLAGRKPYLECMKDYPSSARPQPNSSMFKLRKRQISL